VETLHANSSEMKTKQSKPWATCPRDNRQRDSSSAAAPAGDPSLWKDVAVSPHGVAQTQHRVTTRTQSTALRTGPNADASRTDHANVQCCHVAASSGNAVKDSEARISLHVAVRSANVRLFAERKTTYLPTASCFVTAYFWGGDTPRTMDIHVRRINGQATDVDVHRTELLTLERQFLAVTKY
jgi:hypothetical protein